jgi:hypothetical protein
VTQPARKVWSQDPSSHTALEEATVQAFFDGTVGVGTVARAIDGTIEVSSQGDVRRHHIKRMDGAYEVTPEDVMRLIDAMLANQLSPTDIDAIVFCLEASDHFMWDTDTPAGERIADALFWLGTPEINYPLTEAVLSKIRLYLLTGENTLEDEGPRARPND